MCLQSLLNFHSVLLDEITPIQLHAIEMESAYIRANVRHVFCQTFTLSYLKSDSNLCNKLMLFLSSALQMQGWSLVVRLSIRQNVSFVQCRLIFESWNNRPNVLRIRERVEFSDIANVFASSLSYQFFCPKLCVNVKYCQQ